MKSKYSKSLFVVAIVAALTSPAFATGHKPDPKPVATTNTNVAAAGAVAGAKSSSRSSSNSTSSSRATGGNARAAGGNANAAGCAYRLSDGSCQVEVDQEKIAFPGREYLDDLITKHEAGHCIFSYGGLAVSYHLSDPRALMYSTQPTTPTKAQATLTSIDRSFTRGLYN